MIGAEKTMFVTGGAGYLGRRLIPLASRSGWTVIAPSSAQLDVRDDEAVDRAIRAARPAAVVHLAYRATERDTIVDGSAAVARAATRTGARLVHLSTDVVFHGREAPYEEYDPLDPLSDYGCFKAEAEAAVTAACPDAALIRTSLLYGTGDLGPCQQDVRRALADPGAMAFFTDEIRCFTCVDDVATSIVHLSGAPAVTGPLHVTGPDALSRYAFARAVARWLEMDPAVLRHTSLAQTGLRRPARVVLRTARAADLGVRCRSVGEVLGLPGPAAGQSSSAAS